MKGIILAGGSGTRLYPVTKKTSKQLLPIYDKPMIYYPLSVLMLAGIRDILIISTHNDSPRFKDLLGNGSHFGISLSYAIQDEPNGLAEAFIIGEDFIGKDSVCLILGDNLFHGQNFISILQRVRNYHQENKGATIFGYQVSDPKSFGVVEFDKTKKVLSIEEKPEDPKSNIAVTGLYFYDNDVVEIAKSIEFSKRGELEITSVNNAYLDTGNLNVEILGRGFAWLDTGTFENLLDASLFIQTVQKRQGLKIACIEEISWINGWINNEELKALGKEQIKTAYGQYLLDLVESH